MSTSFRQLSLDELNDEDLAGIRKVVDLDPQTEPQEVYDKLSLGLMFPWRLEAPEGNTILAVEVRDIKQDRILYIWIAAGKGLSKHDKYVVETLEEFARLNNCTALECVTAPYLYEKFLAKLGARVTHVYCRKEIS
jgi:hypothetical protein